MFKIKKKRKRKIPQKTTASTKKQTIVHFNENTYLSANPDVQSAIENGQVKDALQHLQSFGLDEIKLGKRKFHKDLFFNEQVYVQALQDAGVDINFTEKVSCFDHFCQTGYRMILENEIDYLDGSQFHLVVDTISTKSIEGWGYLKGTEKLEQIELEIYKNDALVGKTRTNLYRKDINQAVGGNFAFSFDNSSANEHDVLFARYDFVAVMFGKKIYIATTLGYEKLLPNAEQKLRFKDRIESYLGSYWKKIDQDQELIPYLCQAQSLDGTLPGKLFRPFNGSPVSLYLEHTHSKFRKDQSYALSKRKEELVDYLFWYLDSYSPTRKPLRTPLSVSEISLMNTPMKFSSANYPISNFHLQSIIQEDNTSNLKAYLSENDQYRSFIFDYVLRQYEKGNEVLVSEEYLQVLKNVNEKWEYSAFKLTLFLELLHSRNPDYHIFNLQEEDDRVLYLIFLLLEGLMGKSYILQFMPVEIIDLLLNDTGDGYSLVQHLLEKNIIYTCDDKRVVIERFSRAAIKTFLLLDRYDIDTGRYTTSCCNNWAETFRFTVPESMPTVEIQVIGPFHKASGLGQAARLSADMCEKAGYTVSRVNFDMENPQPEKYSKMMKIDRMPKKAKINLIHINAEMLPEVIANMPDVFTDAYNVGYFYWELNTPAKCHDLAMSLVDEIWVSSDYGVSQYKPFTEKPVTKMHMSYQKEEAIDKEEAKAFLQQKYGLSKEQFVFLVTFDSYSFIQRKNPLGVLIAFLTAFPEEENVRLLIKTHNRSRVAGDPIQMKIWREIDSIIASDYRITLVDETLPYQELLTLKRGVDCYVSLHRSEGWGFGLLEAMNLGLPVITTAYSGNMEFCNEENSWLVPYDEVYLNEDDYIFVEPGQKWAEPSVEDAAEIMKIVYSDPELRKTKAENAKAHVLRHFSMEVVSKRYRERIESILERGRKNVQTNEGNNK